MLGMPDLEVRVLQPTMSSAGFIVSNVMEGGCKSEVNTIQL